MSYTLTDLNELINLAKKVGRKSDTNLRSKGRGKIRITTLEIDSIREEYTLVMQTENLLDLVNLNRQLKVGGQSLTMRNGSLQNHTHFQFVIGDSFLIVKTSPRCLVDL